MSCEHFSCTWGCKFRDNSQDSSGRESIADKIFKIGSETLVRNLAAGKALSKLPKIPEIGAINSVSSKASTNL